MELSCVEELIAEIARGEMVIVMDDQGRENEGDLLIAAEKVTPAVINFMCTHARGLICLPMCGERCDFLGLPPMTHTNKEAHKTAFTVSIEAATGVTTGISAADRARTVQVAVDPASGPQDIVQPGHIFPLRAMPGGVLQRAGHTEAGVDLARLAGCTPAAVIVEIMNEDGTMARRPDLERFARTHGIKMGTVADLIRYRIGHEKTVTRGTTRPLETVYGTFEMTEYYDSFNQTSHLALVMGQPAADRPVLVRVHQVEVFRDTVGALQSSISGSSWSLPAALTHIAEHGEGVLVLLDAAEGSHLSDSLARFQLRATGHHSAGRNNYVTIGTGAQILRDLGVHQMRVLSAPLNFPGLSGFGLEVVESIPYSKKM